MIFQYPEYQLFEETVHKDIAFGPKNLGVSDEEADERVRDAMALVGMGFDEFSQRSPFDLSGGQKRMIAMAGVLAMRPEVLVLDEPTAGLDPKSHEEILGIIEGIRRKTGSTVVIVSHNMDDVARLADRVFVMANGRIVKSGTPREVYGDELFLKGIGLGVPRASAFANRLMAFGPGCPDAKKRGNALSIAAHLGRQPLWPPLTSEELTEALLG
jgi:energy-coupling factor transport system ATP-binding protein